MSRQNKKPYVFLALGCICLIAVFLIIQRRYLFGSRVDWLSQHSVFPEYFRQLFYETGELYPDFAMSIGSGQNIFNFAYYGLLNPYVLLSYLFPVIPMELWLMGVQVVLYVSSVLLFYYWIRQKELRDSICLACTIMFMLATPLLYHFYVQIMFVNYMPFLCLALIGTDRYFQNGKSILLCISVGLMVLTSFYFSICGLMCLCLYALVCYVKQSDLIRIKDMFLAAIQYVVRLFAGIALSGFYLIPTAIPLLSGRGDGAAKKQDLMQLLIPLGNPMRLLYDNYGLGLTTLVLVAILAGIFQKNKQLRLLSILLFLVTAFPIVTYALNGFLYNRVKVLIPLLPLICFQMGLWLSDLEQRKKPQVGILLAGIIVVLYFLMTMEENEFFLICLADFVIVVVSFFVYYKKKKSIWVIMLPALSILFLIGGVQERVSRPAVTRSDLKYQDRKEVSSLMEQAQMPDDYRMEYYDIPKQNSRNINRIFTIKQKITSVYSSTYNANYKTFRNEQFHIEKPIRNVLADGMSPNPIFRQLMGVRYIVDEEKPVGYHLLKKGTNKNLYENPNVRSIAYGVSEKDLISSEDYETLSFPFNQYVFQLGTVVSDGNKDFKNVKKAMEKQTIKVTDEHAFTGNRTGVKKLHWKAQKDDSILFVRFHVKNHSKDQDVEIKIGDSLNKLTKKHYIYYNGNKNFTYAIGVQAGQSETTIEFSDGDYDISKVEMYLAPLKLQQEQYTFQNEKKEKKTSEVLSGTIHMKEDGYFVTSIPYDDNFTILIDDKKVPISRVNDGFLGAKLQKGDHIVSVNYHSPGKKAGSMVSMIGIVACLGFVLLNRRHHG
ncbi:MAG: YfhO family protein [Lachnospiraceae bacterium]|nr:YfhO family protein [Lachnospiraceae bacterium]